MNTRCHALRYCAAGSPHPLPEGILPRTPPLWHLRPWTTATRRHTQDHGVQPAGPWQTPDDPLAHPPRSPGVHLMYGSRTAMCSWCHPLQPFCCAPSELRIPGRSPFLPTPGHYAAIPCRRPTSFRLHVDRTGLRRGPLPTGCPFPRVLLPEGLRAPTPPFLR